MYRLLGTRGEVRERRRQGPVDTPWNTQDVRTTDPDGYRLVYTARRPEGQRDEEFDAMIQGESDRQLGRHTRPTG
jgi:hypothetical protein